jgi:hypothetical protein
VRWLWFSLLLCLSAPVSGSATLDAIAARVDAETITWSQVLQEARIREWENGAGSIPVESLVAALIRRRLFVLEAEKLRLELDREEVLANVETLASAGGDPVAFWAEMASMGIGETDLRRRAGELILMREYLRVRAEMVHVPESQLRSFLAEHSEVFGQTPAAEAREEARSVLAQRRRRQELHRWLNQQVTEGRVRVLGKPS